MNRKGQIKHFKVRASWTLQRANETWQALRSAIHEIHNENESNLSFEELYRNSYNLVLHKFGDLLYNGVGEVVTEHLRRVGDAIAESPDSALLSSVVAAWDKHKRTMCMIQDIMMYMDRTYVKSEKGKMRVYPRGLGIFYECVTMHPQIRGRVLKLLLDTIAAERAGELVDHLIIKNILDMFIELSAKTYAVYQKEFEEFFLGQTLEFYRAESLAYLSSNTCPDYLNKVESRLDEEGQRLRRYLHVSTQPKLKAVLEQELITTHAKALVGMTSSGCVSMFREHKLEDLQRMYNLFRRVPDTLRHVHEALHNYIVEIGGALLKDQTEKKDAVGLIHQIVDMRDKYEEIVQRAFQGAKSFESTMKVAFEEFMNVTEECSEHLSTYCDHMLKKGLKSLSEAEVDQKLDKIVVLFRFLHDRDIFVEYYKRRLAKRLLSGKSVSDDAERTMIGKLKTECGYQITSPLEGMFTDIWLSRKSATDFSKAYTQEEMENVDLKVQVLTNGFWPSEDASPCNIPPVLERLKEKYEKFYLQHHSGRKLRWQVDMGTALLRANFGTHQHELLVSSFQMCILMLFNEKPSYRFDELQQILGIGKVALKQHIVSMTLKKFQILVKEPKCKQVSSSDVFTVNHRFKSKTFKVRVPLVTLKNKRKAAVPAAVQEDRRILLEAAIVRIMKARASLDHNTLVAEVTRQLSSRFNPSPGAIKKRIESLLDRDYLERSSEDRKTYLYVA